MDLTKEVLPPRQALCDSYLPSEKKVRMFWTSLVVVAVGNGVLHFFLGVCS